MRETKGVATTVLVAVIAVAVIAVAATYFVILKEEVSPEEEKAVEWNLIETWSGTVSVQEEKEEGEEEPELLCPYLPPEGQVWVFVGQDLGAVGGLDEYDEGYVDYMGVPAGVTTYTNTQNLDGLYELANWGSGDVKGQAYLEDETFADSMIAIGLFMSGDLGRIVSGERENNIQRLGEWIESAENPIFLRIGYEFDRAGNEYDPENYKQAFRIIVDTLHEMDVNNFVSVWQSSGYSEENLLLWYPGDNYVDWLGYSHFGNGSLEVGEGILSIAREKEKPVMIAEATPRGYDLLLVDGQDAWESWYEPFFSHVRQNKDVVKAIAYINVRWQDQPMWRNQGWGDSRVQADNYVREQWALEMENDMWVHPGSPDPSKEFIPPEDLGEEGEEEEEEEEPEGVILEAEEAQTEGGARSYPDGAASGGQGMAYVMSPGDRFWFENVPVSASTLIIRYASAMEGTLGIYVNGERVAEFEFSTTGSWTGVYKKIEVEIDVPMGAELAMGFEEGDTAANIDYIKLIE